MTNDLDAALCSKYPIIFQHRSSTIHQSCMAWGIDCGDGWYSLIDVLCAELMAPLVQAEYDYKSRYDTRMELDAGTLATTPEYESYASAISIAGAKVRVDQCIQNIPVAAQVKEKFGGLRFYVNNDTDTSRAIINLAEALSYRICEMCGTMREAKLRTDGWHRTLCETCEASRK